MHHQHWSHYTDNIYQLRTIISLCKTFIRSTYISYTMLSFSVSIMYISERIYIIQSKNVFTYLHPIIQNCVDKTDNFGRFGHFKDVETAILQQIISGSPGFKITQYCTYYIQRCYKHTLIARRLAFNSSKHTVAAIGETFLQRKHNHRYSIHR